MNMTTTLESLPEVLRVPDVAALLDISKDLVYQLAAAGELPGTLRLGRCLRFSKAAVIEWARLATPQSEEGPATGPSDATPTVVQPASYVEEGQPDATPRRPRIH